MFSSTRSATWRAPSATAISTQIYARDNEELVRVIDEVIGTIPGVARVRTIIVPWKLKEECDWHVPADLAEEGAAMT